MRYRIKESTPVPLPPADQAALPPMIALVGSDGAGKSTVGAALLAWMEGQWPTRMCHLGKKTGDYSRALRRVPLVGTRAVHSMRKSGDKTRAEGGGGALTSIVVYGISMRRVRKFKRMMALRRQGYVILADRFPQVDLSYRMDGPSLKGKNPRGRIARWLARREHDQYSWMSSHTPTLVIRLNVDLATAAARKPDHNYDALALKIAMVPQTRLNDAPILDIDSSQPLAEVLDLAKAAVAKALEGYHPPAELAQHISQR